MTSLNLIRPLVPGEWSNGVEGYWMPITPSLHCSSTPAIQITLQQNRRRRLIRFFLAFGSTHIGLDQKPVGLRRGEPLVPSFDRDGDGFFQHGNQLLHFKRRGAVA